MSDTETKPDVREGIINTAIPPEEVARLSDDIISALKTVYDPEIPADIFELGLVYKIDIEDDRMVKIVMTLTAPGCPVAGEMPGWVENAVGAVEGVSGVTVEMTFEALSENETLVKIKESGWKENAGALAGSYQNCNGWTQMLASLKSWIELGKALGMDGCNHS